MVNFLKTNELSVAIENLISNSKDRLYLISPYFALSPMMKRAIQKLDNTNAQITVVCRKEEKMTINPDDLEFLQKLRFKNILSLEYLHAKCYMNENNAIVTSLNLLDVSQQRNWEMGFIIDKVDDAPIYEKIKNYVDDILGESKPLQYELKKVEKQVMAPKKIENKRESSTKLVSGYCIRCGNEMPINPEKPLCSKCYPIWAKYSDPEYHEKYCHVCGKESTQSYSKPVCYNCYKKMYK